MSREYDVGYRRPPKHTQFRKGRSGNPNGRPAGTKNIKTDLEEELAEKITVREGGGTKIISKQRGIIKSLVADTLKGNARSTNSLLLLMTRTLKLDEETGPADDSLNSDEREVMAVLEKRLFGGGKAEPAAGRAPIVKEGVKGENT